MSNLRYLTPGEMLAGYPADAHNAFFSAYKKVFGDPAGKIGTGQSSGGQQLTAEVVNKSGAAIDEPFPILKLTKPLITYADNDQAINRGIVFEGDTPDADTDTTNIAVVQGPIGDDIGGRIAVLLGPTWCKVNVTDAAHTHATPSSGDDTKLVSGTSGARMLWKESGTGTKYALIVLGGGGGGAMSVTFGVVTTEVGPATGTIDEITPGEGEVQLYATDGAGVRTPVGSPIGVVNYDPGETYLVRTGVYLGSVAGGTAEVISAFCTLFDEGA